MLTANDEREITAAVVALANGTYHPSMTKNFTREMMRVLGERHKTKLSGVLYNANGRRIKDNGEFTIDNSWLPNGGSIQT